MKTSIYGLTFEELTEWIVEHGEKKFRAQQIWGWLYQKRITEFNEMKNLNASCLALLEEHFYIHTLEEELRQESQDGTIKFLFKLEDGQLVETVLMRLHYALSVCVTTQVGCSIGCSFCAIGILSNNRDLQASEIVEQIMRVQKFLGQRGKVERPSHIVFIGIGEPFDIFQHLVTFLKIVNHQDCLSLQSRHLPVSPS